MSIYDIAMIAVLLGAVFFGYWKGLAWQIASVAAVVVSYILAFRFRDQVATFIQAEPPFNRIGAMLLIFVASSLLIWLTYAYITRSLEQADLDGFNRQMGALVGGITGALLCMVITMFSVSLLGDRARDSIHHSKIGPYVVMGISQVSSIVPDELAKYVDPHIDRFEEHLGHSTDRPINQYPEYNSANRGDSALEPSTIFSFSPGSQPSFQGNWNTAPNQTPQGTNTGYPRSAGNPIQFNYDAPRDGNSGNPSLSIKLDTEELIRGAGEMLKKNLFDNSQPAQ